MQGHGKGQSLRAPKARRKAVSGSITARWRAEARLMELGKSLSVVRNRHTIIEYTATVVGRKVSGQSQPKRSAGPVPQASMLTAYAEPW